ncbi:ring finger domain containing protein [Grosmannia clavigera kw1407]|uniref:RING-type E3 ubiquitin transferase n=1 Tax=Grosmannia clavigera (strain kw1407 / UAMH 11150) TaxID=655863 RepID=F0XN80_GROCL|nr:ring finger domain containing protein [Grosmannia clavigera kw1407]EFX00979.1 ring finger domain containing protein [Grosmannia clavigera kw1407]
MNNEDNSKCRDGRSPAVTTADTNGERSDPLVQDAAPPLETDTAGRPASDDEETRCVICLDAVSEPCTAQPCGHRHFDFLCLLSWLLHRRPTCPLCKATVATVQYGFADGQCKMFIVPRESGVDETGENANPTAFSSSSVVSTAAVRRPRPRRDPPSSLSPSSSSPTALDRRRRVYRLGLYSLHVGANRYSRYYRELTPRMFVQDPDLVSRARAFVRRELTVLLLGGDDNDGHSLPAAASATSRRLSTHAFLLEYVVAILKTMDTQGSAGQAEELLRDFLGRDCARLFLHELRSWLRSPYLTLDSWDRHVQYGAPTTPSRHRSKRRLASRSETALREACQQYDPS